MENFELIKEFDQMVEKKFNEGIGEYIENVKKKHNMTDVDVAFFVGKNYDECNPYELADMSGLEVMRLIELCNDSDQTSEILKQYNENKVMSVSDKIKFLLDMFNVKDDDDLDRLIDAIVDVRDGIESVENDTGKCTNNTDTCSCTEERNLDDMCKCPNECALKEENQKNCDCHDNLGHAKFGFSYYNSDTMDKPIEKTYNLDFDSKNFTNIDWKEIRRFYENIVGQLI